MSVTTTTTTTTISLLSPSSLSLLFYFIYCRCSSFLHFILSHLPYGVINVEVTDPANASANAPADDPAVAASIVVLIYLFSL